MPATAHSADQAVDDLRQFISKGEYGLDAVPSIIKEIIGNDYWRDRTVQSSGALAHFDDFERFVADPPPEGVGTEVQTIVRLCANDVDALDALKQVGVRAWGGDRRSEAFKSNNMTLETEGAKRFTPRRGTDRLYSLRRLSKDRPDLHARVLAGELSPHGAMVEAGFRPRAYRLPTTVLGLVEAIRRHFTPEQTAELVRLLTEVPE